PKPRRTSAGAWPRAPPTRSPGSSSGRPSRSHRSTRRSKASSTRSSLPADSQQEMPMDTIKPVDGSTDQLVADLQGRGVAFVLGAWVDVVGRAKSKLVPVRHLGKALAGSERYTPRGMG